MNRQPSPRELQSLSAYLDDQLSGRDKARLEQRLVSDLPLNNALEDLRVIRDLLRKLPSKPVPRRFTLSPRLVAVRPPLPRSVPAFRFVSITAALLLFLSFAANQSTLLPTALSADMAPQEMLSSTACDQEITANCGVGGGEVPPSELPSSFAAAPVLPTASPDATTALAMPTDFAPTATLQSTPESALRAMQQPTGEIAQNSTDSAVTKVAEISQPVTQPKLIPDVVLLTLAVTFLLCGIIALLVRYLTIRKWRKRK